MVSKTLKTIALLVISAFFTSTASAATIFFQEGFTDSLYTIDTVTGTETFIGNMGLGDSWGFSFNSSGTLYGFHRASSSLYTIDTNNASTTLVGGTNLSGAEALTFNSSGSELFVTSGDFLFSLDPNNANATLVGDIGTTIDGLTLAPAPVSVAGLGIVPAGSIFGVDSGDLYLIDILTPGSTLIGSVSGADETLAFGSDGTLYGHNDAGAFFEIGLDPLSSTQIANTSGSLVFASAVQPGAARVPVPSTVSLLILGLAAIVARRRRS